MNDRHADGHTPDPQAINVIFDGPPGPTAGRFIEVEDNSGRSIRAGTWIERDDGYWSLRIERNPNPAMLAALREARGHIAAERTWLESVGAVMGYSTKAIAQCDSRLATIDAAIQQATGGNDE